MVTNDSIRQYSIKNVLLQALKERKRNIAGIAASLLLLSIAQSLFLLLVGPFLKALFDTNTQSGFLQLDTLLPSMLKNQLPVSLRDIKISREVLTISVPSFMLIASFLKSLATYLYQVEQSAITLYISKKFRDTLFSAIMALPYKQIAKYSPAHWMSMIMNDVLYLQNSFSDIASSIIKDGILVISCLFVLLAIHLPTTIALLVLSPFLAVVLGRLGKRIATYANAWQRNLAVIAATILDIRSRFKFIRAQQGEETEISRFEKLNTIYYQTIRKSILLRSSFAPGLEFFGFVVFAAFIYLIGHGKWLRSFQPIEMIQFFAALGVLLRPLRNLGEQLTRFHETKGSLEASKILFATVNEFTARAPEVLSAGTAKEGSHPIDAKKATYQIDKVSAGYDSVAVTAENICLAAGKTIAIVGPSGGGKSTLIKTFAGLLEPFEYQGSHTLQAICAKASLVSQTPFLFDDTIRANLTYGLVDEIIDDRSIWIYLDLLNLAGDITLLPQKLDNHVGAIEKNMSGGQIQRLVITRALLRAKTIWLFDEATSAIDPATEEKMITELTSAAHQQDKIFILITHRLTMLDQFDEIWFIENGRLTLKGHHLALLDDVRYKTFVTACNTESCG